MAEKQIHWRANNCRLYLYFIEVNESCEPIQNKKVGLWSYWVVKMEWLLIYFLLAVYSNIWGKINCPFRPPTYTRVFGIFFFHLVKYQFWRLIMFLIDARSDHLNHVLSFISISLSLYQAYELFCHV